MNHLVVHISSTSFFFVPPLFQNAARFLYQEHFKSEFVMLRLQRNPTYRRPLNWHTRLFRSSASICISVRLGGWPIVYIWGGAYFQQI
jgi:hypothetical protein